MLNICKNMQNIQNMHSCFKNAALGSEIPVCKTCNAALTHTPVPRMPAEASGNDLMIFYAPSTLYEKKVTLMEVICASV